MNYDEDAPFEVSRYREMQKALPGVDALYDLMLARIMTALPQGGSVLVVGAGGGREVEAFGQADTAFEVTGVDPSADMLSIARWYAERARNAEAITLIQGMTTDIEPPSGGFDAATSILVMHFLPDDETDGGKVAYLSAIKDRLRVGATFVHVDVSMAPGDAGAMEPIFMQHARGMGLDEAGVAAGPRTMATMPIITPSRTEALLKVAGFGDVRPFFQTLWYRGWFATAH